MSSRRVIISGVGPVSGLGVGIGPTWGGLCAGRCAIGPIQAFDASQFECQIAAEIDAKRAYQRNANWKTIRSRRCEYLNDPQYCIHHRSSAFFSPHNNN